MHEKITVRQIGEALYLNPNYLSNLFRQKEGITLSAYIAQEKLKLIRNILLYSPFSYSEIAAYMGFCSQSHLGAFFKKETGMTPGAYREKYGKRDVRDSSPSTGGIE